MAGSVNEIREVKVVYIVAGNDVRVHLSNKGRPSFEHLFFVGEGEHLSTNNGCAFSQRKDGSYEWLSVTLALHTVTNLDNRVRLVLREDACN